MPEGQNLLDLKKKTGITPVFWTSVNYTKSHWTGSFFRNEIQEIRACFWKIINQNVLYLSLTIVRVTCFFKSDWFSNKEQWVVKKYIIKIYLNKDFGNLSEQIWTQSLILFVFVISLIIFYISLISFSLFFLYQIFIEILNKI